MFADVDMAVQTGPIVATVGENVSHFGILHERDNGFMVPIIHARGRYKLRHRLLAKE